MIRLLVGTDPQQHLAERALESSVRCNTSQPVGITWMRAGDPGWDWGGRDMGWATPFSMFRWFVPEFCRYEGRAIYMDVDMLVLGDLTELWEWPIPEGRCGMYAGRMASKADVILWQCDRVPRWGGKDYEGRHCHARNLGAAALLHCRLPQHWDHVDRLQGDTKILHFSALRTQPWKPYPDRYDYAQPHPHPAACELFWKYAQ